MSYSGVTDAISCKTLALTILMTVHTPATAQKKPRVGEQDRQREVREARQRPQRGLHTRTEADHLAVLIGGNNNRLVPVECHQLRKQSAADAAFEIVDTHHWRKMTSDDHVVRQLLPAQRTHTHSWLRIAGRYAYGNALSGRSVLPDERGIGGAVEARVKHENLAVAAHIDNAEQAL